MRQVHEVEVPPPLQDRIRKETYSAKWRKLLRSLYAHVEAEFALWEMLVREKNLAEAVPLATKLARDFPENRRLVTFLAKP